MSLTSYRAAPPRDKPLRALPKNRVPKRLGPTHGERADPVRRLPEKAPLGNAPGSRAVCTNVRVLWKGPDADFRGIYDGRNRLFHPLRRKMAPSGRPCLIPTALIIDCCPCSCGD